MFDYKRAWREEAAPKLLSLPISSLQLVWRTHTEAKGIRQRRDLSLDWPNTGLRADFVAMSNEELSYAAHVVACEGHWHPGYKDWLKPLTKDGTYWRFAAYADEILRSNLGIKTISDVKGFTLEILEGKLRVGFGFKHDWYSVFAGLATQENVDAARKFHEEQDLSNSKTTYKLLQDLKSQINDSRLIDTEKYTQ